MNRKTNSFILKDIISENSNQESSKKKKTKNKFSISSFNKKPQENKNKNDSDRLITDSNRALLPPKVENDFKVFAEKSDVILANRLDNILESVKDKVYTRDLYSRD